MPYLTSGDAWGKTPPSLIPSGHTDKRFTISALVALRHTPQLPSISPSRKGVINWLEICTAGIMRLLLTSLLCGLTAFAAHASKILHTGRLNDAPYVVATPPDWKGGKVFFHVHGWRPADAPHEADLDLSDPLYKNILSAGWAVGRTAFKENGVDHHAHTKDIYALKAWIEAELGPIELLILEGESTAGTLVLRIAELDPELADGVIALSPFIDFEDPSLDSYLTAKPLIPSILMANTPEIIAPVQYTTLAMSMKTPPALRPIIRPGHVNINWLERWEALLALEQSIQTDTPIGYTDGTRKVPARTTGTETLEGRLVNRVTQINPFYGNAFLGYHPDEFAAAGIQSGDTIEIKVHDKSWPVLYGKSYGDVPEGEWVAFPTADDQILLVRNHRDAVKTAQLKVGDHIQIKPPE